MIDLRRKGIAWKVYQLIYGRWGGITKLKIDLRRKGIAWKVYQVIYLLWEDTRRRKIDFGERRQKREISVRFMNPDFENQLCDTVGESS